jgi:hypothetical protein
MQVECDVADLVDGRLFRVIIQAICCKSFDSGIPENLKNDWLALSKIVQTLSSTILSLEINTKVYKADSSSLSTDSEQASEESLSVLPFSSPVCDACVLLMTYRPDIRHYY